MKVNGHDAFQLDVYRAPRHSETERDVPTIDDIGAPTYPDWDAKNSRVVSGPVGRSAPDAFPGEYFASVQEAKKEWLRRSGRIFQNLSVPGRWILRVARK